MGLWNWFKSKPAWLKGGVIFVILIILLMLICYIYAPLHPGFCVRDDLSGCGLCTFMILPLIIVVFSPLPFFIRDSWFFSNLIVVFLYFISGALIGFIVGKIKKK